MAPRRRRTSTPSGRAAAHAAAVSACLVLLFVWAPSAGAQSTRDWAGAVDGGREPLRVAAEPPSAVTADAEPAIPTGNLLSTLRDGGILMIPLVGCSFALVLFGVERAVSLRTGRVVPRLFVSRFIEQLQAGRSWPRR